MPRKGRQKPKADLTSQNEFCLTGPVESRVNPVSGDSIHSQFWPFANQSTTSHCSPTVDYLQLRQQDFPSLSSNPFLSLSSETSAQERLDYHNSHNLPYNTTQGCGAHFYASEIVAGAAECQLQCPQVPLVSLPFVDSNNGDLPLPDVLSQYPYGSCDILDSSAPEFTSPQAGQSLFGDISTKWGQNLQQLQLPPATLLASSSLATGPHGYPGSSPAVS
ncbi:hypothetical protein BT69DRAFT_660894 [Atractiella rhizophila]|nr:hypothetical protein BT69DRAFT_660894 [Atractiella rhizophila]